MLRNLGQENSIIQELIADVRDSTNHNSRSGFRARIETLGFLLGYELSKELQYRDVEVTTPLGRAACRRLVDEPVIATVLRAGLPLHAGLLRAFPEADNCFIGAYRKHSSDGSFTIQMDYLASSDISGRTLVLVDPMLATGASLVLAVEEIKVSYKPARVILMSVIASRQGIANVQTSLPDAEIWTAAIDETLNHKGYIVPGLGDAGDLCFGETTAR